MIQTACLPVSIIGAGPYGVAIAAHLNHLGVNFRIFGSPMRRWLTQMPKGMLLKSEGCASSLPDPSGQRNLAAFCREQGLAFADYGSPVSRDTFAKYALCFQQRFVPQVENIAVRAISKVNEAFQITLDSGETLCSREIVIATGLEHMENTPEQLRTLPAELWSHSAVHYDLGKFVGKEVIVIGAGQSALESAALLKEEGASVTLVVRAQTIAWNKVPILKHRSLYQRVRRPRTQLGEGLQLWVYDNAPQVFHRLPRQVRLSRVKASLGPAGGWWLKDRVMGRTQILLGHQLDSAEERNGRVALRVRAFGKETRELVADHVITATGYRFNFEKLPFLDDALKMQIKHEDQQPRLTSTFESSVSGMYFCGLASANSFGPVMRFLAGTGFTARRISTHVATRQRSAEASFAYLQKCVEK